MTAQPDADLLARGREMRRQLLGPQATDQLDADVYNEDPIMAKFGDLTQEVIFGILWSRDGLDLKTRSLVTAVSDIATGQTEALGLHLRFCRRYGYSEEELTEVILHLMGYVGVPLARRALIKASETFAAIRAEEAQP
jgi:alkylhydroperoxidase/carboxymuconolactone decarboxylase family protein YurZ